jgi:filamentous hemagglutinin family protein
MSIYRTPVSRARRIAHWQIALRTGVAGLAFVTAQTAIANPGGGTVVAGSATINGQGTDRVRIDQSSDRVVINWDNFSIGLGQGVDFRQRNARSIALNRVTGPEISQIMGELTANGQVYLINGNGIVFGKDARVDVAGLVATSADIANDAFMGGGALRFGTPGRAGAKVTNHGTITVRDAGIAAFVAPQVANDGIITAQMGRIAFGGAQAFTLDLHGDNLIRFQVGDAVKQIDDKGALVAIDGVVDARGGSLQITASAARDLVNQSVRIGTPQASAMQVGTDGKVSLVAAKVTIAAPGEVQVGKNVAMDLSSGTNAAVTAARPAKGGNTNNIGWVGSLEGDAGSAPGEAMATNGTGGTLTINAARTILDGTINLDGSKAGGTAHITGSDFLSFGSILSASGAEAGGKIKLDAGGFSLAGRITVNAGLGKGGNVDIHTTRRAIDTGDAFIDASGLHGGTIRYTSDQQIISSGKFRASGSHGFGGSIDVSAPKLDLFSAQFYAQGGIRGGRVRLGGEFQGGKALDVDELLNARTLVATDAVTIDVSAIGMRGNAGEIVIWSDEKTTFLGSAIARGGLVGGLGGQIEISGKETLVYRGTVETARDGQRGGKLLLDPKNIIIADVTNSPSQYGLVLQAFASSFPGPVAPQPGLKAGDNFGTSVSLDGNRLAVGAPQDDGSDGLGINTGAVYLFTFEDESFAAPMLSGVVGRGYTGGKNVSVSTLAGGDQFGFSVSLADIRLAVGAPFASGNPLAGGSADSGVVYLVSFSDLAFNDGAVSGILGSGFSGPASLDVTNLEVLDGFGSSVSLNGDRLAVGALADNGAGNSVMDSGAVYLFTFADSLFNAPVLEAIMGAGYTGGKNVDVALDASDFFGSAVSLSGFGLAVGAPGDDGQGGGTFDYGAAYLYSFSSFDFSDATLESTLGVEYFGPNDVALGLEANDRFGASLGLIGGASFAVLADGDDGLADTATDSGAAYLFTFSAPFFQGPLLAGIIGADYGSLGGRNLSVAGLEAGDTISSLALGFNGLALGVSNDDGRANALTAAGSVYLFTFGDGDFNDGRQVGTLGAGYADFNALSLIGGGLKGFDNFGTAVSLDRNRLAVGAPGDGGVDNDKPGAGAVYLFTFGDSQFSAPTLQAIIGAGYSGGRNIAVARLESGDLFGSAVSLNGLTLAVGAPSDDGRNNDALGAGAVYLFAFDSFDFFAGLASSVLSSESFAPGTISSEGARFGTAVSLSGNVIAVGATGDSGGEPMFPLNDVGAVHIIDLGSTNPTLLSTIGKGYEGTSNVDIATLEENDLFGSAVALDGLRLTVGAPGDDGVVGGSIDAGAVYLLTFADSSFTGGTNVGIIGAGYEGASGFTPMGLGAGDNFGSAVSLSGLQLVVGAAGDDGRFDTQNNAGAAYLFTSNDSAFNGIAQAGIIGADYIGGSSFSVKLSKGEAFGSAVSFDAGQLVVGAANNPGQANSAPGSGAAYLFSFAGNNFAGVRLHDTLGAGYAGLRGVSVGRLDSGDQFGGSVSLDGTRLAVGAPFDDGFGEDLPDSGAVYLFSFADLAFSAPMLQGIIGSGYTGGKNIALGQLDIGDLFGASVSLDGLQLAVGALADQGLGNAAGAGTGAVYLFTFDDAAFAGGALQATIGSGYAGGKNIDLGALLETGDEFGRALSLNSGRLAVGAPGDDGLSGSFTDAGAVYLFSFADIFFDGGLTEGTIGLGYTLGPRDLDINRPDTQLEAFDRFGSAVALDGVRLFVGAPNDQGLNNTLSNVGAVYGIAFTNTFFDLPQLIRVIGSGYVEVNDTNVTSISDFDRFGSSVSASGNQLAIGAIGDGGATGSIESAGAVYLFLNSGPTYGQFGILGAGYGGDNDHPIGKLEVDDFFGSSVSLNQNRLAVGAFGDDGVQNTNGDAGGVYLFNFADDSFAGLSLAGTLGSGYGAAKNLDLLGDFADNLGASVALVGNRLAIGVPGARRAGGGEVSLGAVYLFTFADAEFSAPTLTGIIGQGFSGAGSFDIGVLDNGDQFGAALSIDGLRLAIGAPGDDGASGTVTNAGAVYLFSFADTSFGTPTLEARLGAGYTGGKNRSVALDANDRFGTSLSLAGTQLAIGTPGDDGALDTVNNAGAVLLFNFVDLAFAGGERVGTIGRDYNTIAADFDFTTLDPDDRFGSSVAQSGLALAVGATGDQGFANVSAGPVGAVYTFLFADIDFDGPMLNSTIGLDYFSGSGTPFDIPIGDLDVGDDFGAALAFDGLQLLIGAPGDAGASNRSGVNTGAVYQLVFGDATFAFAPVTAKVGRGYASGGDLSLPGLAAGDRFGAGLALNAGRMVVGAPGDDGVLDQRPDFGAAYLFTADNNGQGGGLALVGTIGSGYRNGTTSSLAAQGIATNERFGTSVALSGRRLAIGAPLDSGASGLLAESGAVYLFSFSDLAFGTPVLEAVIGSGYTGGNNFSVANLGANDRFGTSVALFGDTFGELVVGADGDDGFGDLFNDTGAVYRFSLLFDPFAPPSGLFTGVSLTGVIGAGYTGPGDINVTLDNEDFFGRSVATTGFELMIGAPGDDGFGNPGTVDNSGAVHLFGTVSTALAKVGTIGSGYTGISSLDLVQLGAGDAFGSALSGDVAPEGTFVRLVVGAPLDEGASDLGGGSGDFGAIYSFVFPFINFQNGQQVSIIGRGYTGGNDFDIGTLAVDDRFGISVSVNGGRLAVGSQQDNGLFDDVTDAGAVYLFSFGNNAFVSPTLQATIGADYSGGRNLSVPIEANDSFGYSVALDGNRLAVGALFDDGPGNGSADNGAVYLYTFDDAVFSGGRLAGTIGAGYRSTLGLDLAAPVTPTFVQLGGGDGFGSALSLDGFRLAIGAPNDDGSTVTLNDAGAVYLFTFTDTEFGGATLQAVLGHGYVGGKNLFVTQVDANDNFGAAVSLDGNRLAVGAPGDDGAGNGLVAGGAVYLFSFADLQFSGGVLQGTIGSGYVGGKNVSLAPTLDSDDRFGSSVSLGGLSLAVGAPGDDGASGSITDSGAAYLFTFTDFLFQGGTRVGTIGAGYTGGNNIDLALDGGDFFAASLSLDGTRLAVGARGDDGSGDGLADSGAAYLFTFDDVNFVNGVQRGIVGASYAGPGDIDTVLTPFGFGSNGFFGTSIALDGQRLAIGGPQIVSTIASPGGSGAVYLFTFTDAIFGGGTIADILGKGAENFGTNLDLDVELEAFDLFGTAVALDGDRLVVGAAGDDGRGNGAASLDSGAVYLFTFNGPDFSGMQLRGNVGAGYTRGLNTSVTQLAAGDGFGAAISLNGNRLAVGAPGDDGLGDSLIDSGAVYLFTFADADFASPVLQGILGAGYTGGKNLSVSELRAGSLFGSAVSLDGDRLAVGASGDAGASASRGGAGAAYLFTFADAAFATPTLASIIGLGYSGSNDFGISLDAGDQLGFAISLSGTRLAIGAVGDDGNGDTTPDMGAVYLFNFADLAFSTPDLAGKIGRGYGEVGDFDLTGTLDDSDAFGSSVSLDGDRLAVGASLDDGLANGATNAGAVYLFTFADSAFASPQLARTMGALYAGANGVGGLAASERFGASVALSGDVLAVGATFDQLVAGSPVQAGVVHLFSFSDPEFLADPVRTSRLGSGFEAAGDFSVSGIADGDLFGSSISIDTGRLVVGAVGDDGPDNQVVGSGAVYTFALSGGGLPGLNFGDNPGADVTISASALAALLAGGTAVELQANNDITVTSAILVDNPLGDGGNLTFRAGRSILINAGIFTDNGSFSAIANDSVTNGVVDAFRDPGDALISFGSDGFIDTGLGNVSIRMNSGSGLSFSQSGAISLGSITANQISIFNEGSSGNNAVTVNSNAVLTASGPGDAIVVLSDVFTNLAIAGAGAFNLTGGGRFLVYASDYEAINRGGLIGNNLYNRTYVGAPPGSITQPGNLFIFSRQPILTFTADDATRTYGQGAPGFTFQFTGLVNGDSDSYAFSGAPNLFDTGSGNAGIDSILIEQGSLFSDVGYGFDFVAGALTTLRAQLTITADDATRTYGDSNPLFTASFSGFVNGDDASVLSGLNFTTLADEFSDVGSYIISPFEAFAANYDITFVDGTLTITKALLTVTADNASREYGLANPAFTGSITGFRNSDTDSVVSGLVYGSVADITSNAGTYAITGSGATATNYDFSYVPGTLTVTKALLTVTADNSTREYGLADPTFTGSITGFRNSDTASVVSGLVYGSTAVLNSGIGTYAITGSGATSTNYDFSYVPGTLTITRALLTVTADNATREYGLANPTLTGTISGLRAGDTASVVSGLVYGTTATTSSNVGTFAITASGGTAANYDFTYAPGTLTITRALLTVTADNASRVYGDANPTFTGSITGFRNSDTASVVSGLVYNTVADINSNAGTYGIIGAFATATNYDFAYVPGTLTITKALLTVTADNATREYGLADPAFTGSITGFRNSDTASVVSGLVYGSTAVLNSGIGTYAITGSGATSTNYDFSYVPGTLTITRALLTVTADNATREYGLANPALTGTISGLRAGDTASVVSGLVYGTTATTSSNVGTFAITASGGTAANYDFTYAPGTLTITRALLTVTADNASRVYGDANPTFTGSIAGFRNSDTASVISGLVYGSVADITSNAGTYAITGSGASATNYDFSYVPGTLTVTRALLTVTADNATREYGLADPTFTGSITGFRNSDTASVISGLVYGSTAVLNSGIGTYAINGSGATSTNYDFSYLPGTLTITRALLTVTADNATREYGLANPTLTGTISGLRAGDTASVVSGLVYGTTATPSSNVGTFAITASGGTAANYDFTYAPGTLTITRALLTVTADNASRVYGDANPTFTGSITGFRNSDTASVVSGLVYNTVADINSNAGTYGIIGAFATATNYDFAYVPGTLTITKALLTVTADNATREYGLADPAFTGSITGFRNSDTASVISGLVYGSTAVLNSGIGTYAINGSGATSTNYDFSYVPGTLTITRALLTVTADNATREYGLANPTLTGTISGLRAGDTASVVSGLVYGTTATPSSNVGTFAITASGGTAANYDFTYAPGTLTITRALLTVTADNASRVYGDANPVFTGSVSGLRAGDTASVVSGLVYGTTATTTSNVGTFAITASGGSAANYDFAYVPGTLTITRALLTVTADNATREYGLANPTFTGSVTGFRNGDTASVISGLVYGSAATTASNVGTFAITGSGATATNYDFSYLPGTLTITRALLTVTADNATREYGLANPVFTGTISGLRNGDTASVISGLAFGSVATTASNVGTYAIIGSGAAATNYSFAYVPGTLTITRALLTVTADNATREYGLANPVFTGTISGLRAGDTASVVSGLVYGSVGTSASNVGNYAITASGAAATNYDFAYVPGTLTITRALLTVTADNKTREYGLANPALTSMISGLRNGDSAAVVSGLVLATSATQASGVGSYAIGISGGSALNYDFNYVPGTLAITPATLTVAIDSKTRVYGSANPELTASITGFRNGDDASVVSGLRLRTGALTQSDVGSYLITGSGANAANYRFDYLPGTLSITKALLQVRVNNASREYGLANPVFSARILGFRNGDNASVISGLIFGTPALIGSDVGNYAITASGASALNYDFSYVPGRLTINQARLLITANNLTMTQGSGDPVLTVTYSGLRNGDAPDVVTGLVLRSSGGGNAGPGQYIINASRGTARNYQITYRPGVMTVLPATPPATDPPATGSNPPTTGGTPPATGGSANPPVFTFVPPAEGTTPPAANPPADAAAGAAPVPPVSAPAAAGSEPANAATPQAAAPAPVTTMPVRGAVIVPVPPESLNPMQLLQGLSAPLPVLVAPESRPDDGDVQDPSQGDGQGTGCAYISLCNGTPVPLWTYQPAQ